MRVNREIYKQISRTRGEGSAQAYRINRVGVERKAADELRASKAHLREAMDSTDDISQDVLPESPKEPAIKPEPLLVPLVNFAPPELLRQRETS